MRVDHFDEPVAAGYDEACADMFEPAVVGPTVDFLAALAGDGAPSSSASAPDGSHCR